MTQLNQIIALAAGTKARAESDLTQVYHKLGKDVLLAGREKTYRPKDEEGDRHPPDSQRVQLKVADAMSEVARIQARLFDVIATQDQTNLEAVADVIVGDVHILSNVPAVHLLFLEKQLTDLHTVICKLPTLDPAYEWTYNAAAGCWSTPPTDTVRTQKVLGNHQMAPATKEHPEQVQTFTKDVQVGTWTQTLFSGAIPEDEKNAMRDRVRALRDAVISARHVANTTEVTPVEEGKSIFDFVLGVQTES